MEDPVEYRIDGVTQSQIKPEIGYTFDAGLRSILRHDPDVILLGEIRDSESAKIAIRAAQTGHLVFSTLHTLNNDQSIQRLKSLGIEESSLSQVLILNLSQRLVRKICQKCSGEGCSSCNETGYFGREVIYQISSLKSELLSFKDSIEIKLKQKITDKAEIKRVIND